MSKKAVAYIRVSDMGPTGEKDSPDTQLEEIKKYCIQNDYELIGSYQDLDISGGTDNRPDFQRLFEDARKEKFEVVVVYNLSRFSRNVQHTISYVQELSDLDIDFASTKETFLRTDTPEGRLMFHITASVAEYQREQIGQTVRDNMLSIAARQGRFLGGLAPLGYTVKEDKTGFVIDEEEAVVVRWLFNEYRNGKGMDALTRTLTEDNALGRDKFSKSTIRAILLNPVYVGDFYYNKRRKTTSGKRKKNEENDWIIVKNRHEPIIDRELFNEVQELLKSKARGKGTFNPNKAATKHLLTGLLTCSCGNTFNGNPKYNNAGKKYEYYYCSGRQRHSRAFCDAKGLRVDKVDPLVISTLEDVVSKKKLLSAFNSQFATLTTEEADKLKRKVSLQRQIVRKNEQINNLMDRSLRTKNEKIIERFDREMITLQEEIEEVQVELEQFDTTNNLLVEKAEELKHSIITSEKFELSVNFLNYVDKEIQRKVIGELIDKIDVVQLEDGNTKLDIHFKFDSENIELVKNISKLDYKNLETEKELLHKIMKIAVENNSESSPRKPLSAQNSEDCVGDGHPRPSVSNSLLKKDCEFSFKTEHAILF
ncbi:recombinase family protein [Salmonella enterica]|nr:recombinase family protein [Salmonella enterica]